MSDGIVIDQRYRLGAVLRESPIAIVYEARHRNGVEAWLKVPRGPEHAGAIVIESRVANALAENAVNVRDDGTTEDGLPYLVLEPVTGQRLDHWRDLAGGRAPPDEALGLGDELCRAMEIMHEAGFALGLLRPDAILVLPTGGVCLLELEHAKPATPAAIREDALRVGRVLYEALSGVAAIGTFASLPELLPELPRALTVTVDAAARGRFAAIGELREALHRSSSEWPGEVRRPTPSLPAVARPSEGPGPSGDAVHLPSDAGAMFDPRDLVRDSERALPVRKDASRPSMPLGRPTTPADGHRLGAVRPTHASAGDLEAPPIAAFERVPRPAVAPPSALGGFLAVGFGVGILAASLALVAFATSKDETAPRAPATPAIRSAAATPPPMPSPDPAAIASAVAAAADVVELDEPTEKASVPASPSTARDAADDPTGQTTFRFEGSLSPRLVLVDGNVIGVTTKEVRVRCGSHTVRIGGKGALRTLDLPCGADQRIMIESNGAWRAE